MDIKDNLITQDPIQFGGFIIYQPTYEEIKNNITIKEFDKLIFPYCIDLDFLGIEDKTLNLFSDVIMKDEMLLNLLILSLKFICKTESIYLYEGGLKINDGILYEGNFQEFSKIIREIASKDILKPEKRPKFDAQIGTPEWEDANERWLKLQKHRKKKEMEDSIQFYDVLNVCEFFKFYIPIETIKKWTLFNIMRCFKVKTSVYNWDNEFSAYLASQGYGKLDENKHWFKQIKL